jgi:hypothetical protein
MDSRVTDEPCLIARRSAILSLKHLPASSGALMTDAITFALTILAAALRVPVEA